MENLSNKKLLINDINSNNFEVNSNNSEFKSNNEKKQIEEMAKVIAKADDTCRAKTLANALYNADYRKQSEGEWVFKRTYYEADECNCSVCGQLMTTAKGVRMNYCPNCGAKMKGGAE